LKFVFFAGKGGAGKTTSAAAFAISASASAARRPPAVLIVSTDPAHSLGDVLGVKLSAAPRRVAGRIDAVELDAPRAFARWLRHHHAALAEILEHGTWLDRADVDALLQLSIPGVDELAAFLEIAEVASDGSALRRNRKGSYELIVVDTAPTGHALRLLSAPKTVAAVADVFDALQEQHRLIRDQLARVGGRPEAADRLIAMLAQQANATARLLHDSSKTTIRWVTLAEDMSLAESEDGVRALERGGISVSDIVVNNVLPDGGPCPVCDRRRFEERRTIAAIKRRLGRGRRLTLIAAQLREPRGVRALVALGREIADRSPLPAAGSLKSRPSAVSQLPSPGRADALAAFRGASLLFFGGKGGVGKTTVSAAAAAQLAREDPKRRVLLLSADPAHSLADVFRSPIGDTPQAVAGAPANLRVRELDAARAFSVRRARIEAAFGEIASTFGASADSSSGSHGVRVESPSAAAAELIDLAPPGVDELFGVLSVVDARVAYDLIVVDTAPTGHALRLLEMPEVAREWTQVLLRMLLKYRSLVRPGRLAEELLGVAKSIRELQTLLRDAAQTRFVVVTRAAEVPRRETERLVERLHRLRVAVPAVVVNAMTLAPGRCARCRAVAAVESRELPMLRRGCARRCAIIQTPLSAPPPRGPRALESWVHSWTATGR
jgi:arsenite/tail-anchored protein-transporting ATPase